MGRSDGRQIARLERGAGRLVVGREAGEIGRHAGVGQLGLGAGDDADPGQPAAAIAGNITTLSSTIASGVKPRQQLPQRRFGGDRGVDDRLPGRRHIGLELVDRAQLEMRQMALDESLPVALALAVGERLVGRQVMLLEAVVGKHARKAGMADEHRPRPARPQGLRDADAIERRAKAGFRKQGDGELARASTRALAFSSAG